MALGSPKRAERRGHPHCGTEHGGGRASYGHAGKLHQRSAKIRTGTGTVGLEPRRATVADEFHLLVTLEHEGQALEQQLVVDRHYDEDVDLYGQ